jgi:predicted esterase
LKDRYNISGVYLLGHSQGASTAYVAGIERHQLFDGIVAIAGSLNTYWLSDTTLTAGNDLHVLIVHGKNDRTFRFVEAISARRLLENHGYDVTLIEHNGTHALPDKGKMKQIAKWIMDAPGK